MITKEIEFTSEDGLVLKGTLHIPNVEVSGVAVIIAGSGPTDRNGNSTAGGDSVFQQINLYKDIAEFCANNGMAVLTYDKRSCSIYAAQWQKILGGDIKKISKFFSFKNTVKDAQKAIQAARQNLGMPATKPVTLIGHSEGGLVALKIAKEQKIDNLVLLATAGRTLADVLKEQIFENVKRQTNDESIAQQFVDHTTDAMDAFRSGKPLPSTLPPGLIPLFNDTTRQFFKEILDIDPVQLARKINSKTIIFNGTNDMQVHHQKDAELLFNAFKSRGAAADQQQLIKIDQASHCFKKADDPNDLQKAFGGPVAPELLHELKTFLGAKKAPSIQPRKKPSPKPEP